MPELPRRSDGDGLLCKRCDVYVGFGALGVAKPPLDVPNDQLNHVCWVCRRTASEIEEAQRDRGGPMQVTVDLIRRLLEERDHLRALERDISQAYGAAEQEEWPGDDSLLDRAQTRLEMAHGPILEAVDLLQQHIGSVEVDRAGLGVP